MRAKTGTTGAKGAAANKIIPMVISDPKPQSFVAARTRIGTTTKFAVTTSPNPPCGARCNLRDCKPHSDSREEASQGTDGEQADDVFCLHDR
jgi:hypothetical protein